MKVTLIPLGRSLQRDAGAPDYFRFPRVVAAADGTSKPGILPLKDRLFLGFHEKGAVIEVISYNDDAGRFEFQVVRDYKKGKTPQGVLRAAQPVPRLPPERRADLRPPAVGRNAGHRRSPPACATRDATSTASNWPVPTLRISSTRRPIAPICSRSGRRCGSGAAARAKRANAAAYRPSRPPSTMHAAARYPAPSLLPALDRTWKTRWPQGLAIANPDLPNRDPLAVLPDASHDPLLLRPPLGIWTAPDKTAFVVGLAGMLDVNAVLHLKPADLSAPLERLRARGSFSARPFSLALLDDLLAELGGPRQPRQASLPPARTEPASAILEAGPLVAPFRTHCASCHGHHAAASAQLPARQSGRGRGQTRPLRTPHVRAPQHGGRAGSRTQQAADAAGRRARQPRHRSRALGRIARAGRAETPGRQPPARPGPGQPAAAALRAAASLPAAVQLRGACAMSPAESRCSGCRFFLWALLALLALGVLGAAIRFLPDRPVTYDDPVDHFKYGSTGGERNMGFPYWLFQVLPEVCPDLLRARAINRSASSSSPAATCPWACRSGGISASTASSSTARCATPPPCALRPTPNRCWLRACRPTSSI